MSTRLPVEVNPYRLVEQCRILEGGYDIKNFSRMADILADNSGAVSVSLSFLRNESGLPAIKGQVTGELSLTCQRCLEPTSVAIDNSIEVVLVSTDEEAERLQGGYDTYLVEDGRIILQDFVEDEVLLNIPLLVVHDQCEPYKPLIEAEPEAITQAVREERENPFAVLQNLKNPGS
ncbi:MAG: hypothetical protein CSB47_05170 [Proteobacteria bacterium]|nr:MAG: hypothetical protein CSB47_05170 [Pseudomonadota bacterium]